MCARFHDYTYPPLRGMVMCPSCGGVEAEVWGDGTVRADCPHVRRRLRRAVRRDPRPYEMWGGRPGYAVAPWGAVLLLRGGGYRYAAPFGGGRSVYLLGEHDGVHVAIALDEDEWLWLSYPSHYPCGETPPVLPPAELAARTLIGSEHQGLVVFEPLSVRGGEDDEREPA